MKVWIVQKNLLFRIDACYLVAKQKDFFAIHSHGRSLLFLLNYVYPLPVFLLFFL